MQYVSGYYRGKDEEEKTTAAPQQDQVLIAAFLLAGTTLTIAVVFWQLTLSLIILGSISYLSRLLYIKKQRQLQSGLRVTYMANKVSIL